MNRISNAAVKPTAAFKTAASAGENSTEISQIVSHLRTHMNQRIIGQERFVDRLLLALFADGHILLEGAPGLAKTKAVNALAEVIDCDARRIQFTPDLLPSDLTGTDIYSAKKEQFSFQKGPLFNHLVLADEINRAPAKVQSALLEAMAERQISVGGQTYPLPELFLVMATQNPIEQEGTYPLPEAQLDRFLLQVNIDYPSAQAEREILRLVHNEAQGSVEQLAQRVAIDDILVARHAALATHASEALLQYIIQIVQATRHSEKFGTELAGLIEYGASPRSTIALDRCARVHAWMRGSDYVTPSDVQGVVQDVLRHRIILSFEAEAEGYSCEDVINMLIDLVPVS